ncbi:unnamed protein product [Spirodela intermedia]|uniref:Zinc finger PHD-type domain-containing protein n=1 Tax=Spirodela intermedia TaxID=51605 RepID=A0A7I8J130_SPIIN|nr:unnamed protein product [Spirodela intermedia]CAA6663934.1 unnamed protein product [Spirodela intermedia]
MVVNGRPLKRAKKRVTADLYDLLTFPAGAGIGFDGPFRTNVRSFLSRHARLPPPSSVLSPAAAPHLLTWRVSFRIGGPKTAEESGRRIPIAKPPTIPPRRSSSISTWSKKTSRDPDRCTATSWSGHPVCGKRYHFIIRNELTSSTHPDQTCMRCGSMLQCSTCNHEMTADDLEDWAYLQLGDTTHLLHGVIHTNGYGHLLRVNGREGGSRVLTGCDVMGFWDRLCGMLRVRKVTVMDISKKHGLEYRLLHAVTAGHSWYGNWGYEFGTGSFALTVDAYRKAVEALANLPLSDTISMYCALSDCQLLTVGELFSFVTRLLRDAEGRRPPSGTPACGAAAPSGVLCAWTGEEVGRLEAAMVKVLRAAGVPVGLLAGPPRRRLPAGLLLPGPSRLLPQGPCREVRRDGMVVIVRCNAETRAIEFSLVTVGGERTAGWSGPTRHQILRDLRFLYDALLNPGTMHPFRPRPLRQLAQQYAMRLLDCKQFIKDYDRSSSRVGGPNPPAIRVWCQAELDQPKHYAPPPAELVVLPVTATVGDLKAEATRAFRETYLAFQRFHVEQLSEYGDVADRAPVKLLVGSEGTVRVRGRWTGDLQRLGQFRMERGLENWTVDCSCGAKDDDGERMLACDACGVWQHTRCSGIDDAMEVPSRFVCRRCSGPRRPGGPGRKCRYPRDSSGMAGRCSTNAAAGPTFMDGGGYGCLTQVR